MKLEDEVCLLEQAEALKALGVTQNSRYSWCGNKDLVPKEHNPENKPWVFVDLTVPPNAQAEEYRSMVPSSGPFAAAFNVAELGVMVAPSLYTPFMLQGHKRLALGVYQIVGNGPRPYWQGEYGGRPYGAYTTEANAKAAILIYQIEQGHTTVEKVNERLLNA